MPPIGQGQSSGVGSEGKAPRSLKDLVPGNHLLLIKIYRPQQPVMKLIQRFFPQILPNFEFELKFSVQPYASSIREDPAYLPVTYQYLKYTELKSFFGHRVCTPIPLDTLLKIDLRLFYFSVTQYVSLLVNHQSISCHWSLSIPLENINLNILIQSKLKEIDLVVLKYKQNCKTVHFFKTRSDININLHISLNDG